MQIGKPREAVRNPKRIIAPIPIKLPDIPKRDKETEAIPAEGPFRVPDYAELPVPAKIGGN